MKRTPQLFALMGVSLFAVSLPALAAKPTWAKKATAFPEQCASWYPDKAQPCKPIRVVAPDGKRSVQVRYRKKAVSGTDWFMQAYMRVTTPGMGKREVELPEGYQNIDLLWSPDSKTFFVNGGNGTYSDFWVYVYFADGPTKPRDITDEAQRDMLKEFPPCQAAFPNAEDATGCRKGSWPANPATCMNENDPKYSPEYNMTGIDWITPSSILVIAEIPCGSLYGGIMCQVMGYELQVPTGQIIKRIDARHLKLEWQKSIAWDFRVPDPPKYCSTSNSPKLSDSGSAQ